MPPKVKVQKDDIIRAALALVRERGADALNARDLAAVLGCSTQPIFSNFASMEELLSVLYKTAHEQYLLSLEDSVRRGDCPPYKAFGMAYIRFAAEERELFKMLF
ncbi:MAG: TetR/AcrR family transcriptional regulator, partial [Clostridia bacterium]|nr:TetR/AcrR family transcriptional regulator [Clostridia bacterium]